MARMAATANMRTTSERKGPPMAKRFRFRGMAFSLPAKEECKDHPQSGFVTTTQLLPRRSGIAQSAAISPAAVPSGPIGRPSTARRITWRTLAFDRNRPWASMMPPPCRGSILRNDGATKSVAYARGDDVDVLAKCGQRAKTRQEQRSNGSSCHRAMKPCT